MKNLKSILFYTLLFTVVLAGSSFAAGGADPFAKPMKKLTDVFKNVRMFVFVIGGFGLIALAVAAIFGKIQWKWAAGLGLGLVVVAIAATVVEYATGASAKGTSDLADTLN